MVELPTKFSNIGGEGEGLKGFSFQRGVAGKERGERSQGALQFYMKNKLKSEIFNDKKVYRQKCFSPS